jgi:hypothetical protein
MPSTCGRAPFETKSEDSCLVRQSQRTDPSVCTFGVCPWEIFLEDGELYRVYQFCRQALRHEERKKKGKATEHIYGVLYLQDFEALCRLFMIRPDRRLEAMAWAALVADAAQEAVGRPKPHDDEDE